MRVMFRVPLLLAVLTASVVTAAPARRAVAAPTFHLRLTKSEPAKDATVEAPRVLRLWFSEPATLAVTSVKLKGADDADVALAKPSFSGDASQPIEVAVTGMLKPGRYTVSYRTASKDMHPVTGEFSFTVR